MKGSESGKISIVVGTYEKTLHGYELEISKHGPSLNRIFAFVTNHLGCIKTVRLDSSSKWLVSGSTDETIRYVPIPLPFHLFSPFHVLLLGSVH